MSRNLRTGLGLFAVLVVTLGIGAVVPMWEALSAFPQMPSAYEAKEMCSCRWVEGRTAGACEKFVAQSVVPIQGRDVDEAAKKVTVHALWTSSSAHWVDARTGCAPTP